MPPVPGGLAVVQQELESLGSQYANIVNLNKQVYGPFYANILRKLLFGEEATGKAAGAKQEPELPYSSSIPHAVLRNS